MNPRLLVARPYQALVALAACTVALPAPAVERISVSTTGAQGNSQSRFPVISGNGRYVAFASDASTLVPGDTNNATDVFVRDRVLGTTTRVSLTAAGAQSVGASNYPSISGDGSRIAFTSYGGLLPDSGFLNCYLLDRAAGTVSMIDRRPSGQPATTVCQPPTLSYDGRRAAFGSRDNGLVAGDTNGWADVFIRDLPTATTYRVGLGPGGVQGNQDVDNVRIAAGGDHAIYTSTASNLVPGDTNGVRDAFVAGLDGSTRRISLGPVSTQPNAEVGNIVATNWDGSIVAFSTTASNMPDWAPFAESTLYVRLPGSDTTVAISVPLSTSLPREGFNEEPDFSATGQYLVFYSTDQLIPGPDVTSGIYVVDLVEGLIALVSLLPNGQPAGGNAGPPRISADGSGIVWYSTSADLVPGDTNGTWDVFYARNPLYPEQIFATGFE
ncbi:PD40 domain-containing protein [Dokdonella koreensis]|uniref:WD40 domain protein beta Propeller n=1 Tax=Dokdonella koreensis DS-123 TaxID=1300342 RepID=A0A167G7U2_9GAMM|nr:PD40 domain-containing protein [Dokdonella koreensis]ANB16238.1 WD40 domain protein beta Propeller [Dokdonella koreensis DS-123]